ncbi:MAG: aldo/keto reductase [Elusimicrobia bacterium]|nr:aldo/keto reductase [Elusimicrobiota bacterium]
MRKRPLGKTGLTVSELGYGAWGIGGGMWADADDNLALAALRRSLELGVDFFDTAYVYGDGHSERLIGRVLKETGASAAVASKIPPKNGRWPSVGGVSEAFPPGWIASCTERSLKNLGKERLDLQQFHVWNDRWLDDPAWGETWAAVERLKTEGKIAHWGVSIDSRAPRSALRLAASGLCESLQAIYNLFEQEPQDELFPLCEKHGVGVLVRVPFDEGGLTGTLTKKTTFPPGDFRGSYFSGSMLGETVRRADALKKKLVPKFGATLAEAALRYTLAPKAVSCVIPGMRRPLNVERNVQAAARPPLPQELLSALRAHAWKRPNTSN